MSRAGRPQKAAPTPRACERPEPAEDLGGGKFGAQRPRGGRLVRPGKFFSPDRLAAAPAGSSALRDMQGRACGNGRKGDVADSPRGLHAKGPALADVLGFKRSSAQVARYGGTGDKAAIRSAEHTQPFKDRTAGTGRNQRKKAVHVRAGPCGLRFTRRNCTDTGRKRPPASHPDLPSLRCGQCSGREARAWVRKLRLIGDSPAGQSALSGESGAARSSQRRVRQGRTQRFRLGGAVAEGR